MSFVYNRAKAGFLDGTLDWDSAQSFKVMLVTTAYLANPDHNVVADVASELSGGGYTGGFGGAGRKVIGTRSVQQDDGADRAELHGDPVSWAALTAADIGAAIIIRENTSDADSELVAYIDSGGFPFAVTGGNFTVTPHADGWVTLS